MIGVITGDIVASRSKQATQWLKPLEQSLSAYGESPRQWEIFRGDSFQLEVMPEEVFAAALTIKARIKTFDSLDVRMAIGIGTKDYQSDKITTSNGTAFIHSGECFDALHKKTLAVKSPWPDFDEGMNVAFSLATLTMDHWTTTSAATILALLENPELNQAGIAEKMNKSQSNISAALGRAGYKEIMTLETYFRKVIKSLL